MTRFLIVGPALALATALATGCGGGEGAEGVASAQSAAAAPSASASADAGQARKYAECMRENGVPDFPDPGPDGTFDLKSIAGAGVDREKIRKASEACRELRPDGGVMRELNPAQQEKLRQWAQCMRDNGVDVPDPDPNGGALFGPDGNIDPDDPAFEKAMETCQDKLGTIRGGAGS